MGLQRYGADGRRDAIEDRVVLKGPTVAHHRSHDRVHLSLPHQYLLNGSLLLSPVGRARRPMGLPVEKSDPLGPSDCPEGLLRRGPVMPWYSVKAM